MSAASQFFGGGGGGAPLSQGGDAGPGITVAELLLVAGGMPGYGGQFGGGGNSGTVIVSKAFLFTQGTSYTITIGGSASSSSIVGGTVNLVAPGRAYSNPGVGDFKAGAGVGTLQIDQYTFAYGQPSGWTGFAPSGFIQSGGGGAGQPGGPGSSGGAITSGGDGIYVDILSPGIVVGGGGGGHRQNQTDAYGGDGGGGKGSNLNPTTGTAGTANTGGGGGSGPAGGGAGGSGVCIIRWPTAYPDAPAVSGNTPTPAQPGYRVYRWNSGPGSITF